MAPARFLRLKRTAQLFIEHGEQGITAIPVVFWMLITALMTQGAEVCPCVHILCLCAR